MGEIGADLLETVAPYVKMGQLGGVDEAGVESIVEVVGVVGNLVGEVGNLGLQGGLVGGGVFVEALEYLERKVQAGEFGIFGLQDLDDAEALVVVVEAAVIAHKAIELGLAGMAEGGMA